MIFVVSYIESFVMIECFYLIDCVLCVDIFVLNCILQDDGCYVVCLLVMFFYLQGGGQFSDIGCIGDVEVLCVVSESEGIVYYIVVFVVVGLVVVVVDVELCWLYVCLYLVGYVIG